MKARPIALCARASRVRLDRPGCRGQELGAGRIGILSEAVRDLPKLGDGKGGVHRCEIRIELDGLAEQSPRCGEVLAIPAQQVPHAALVKLPRPEMGWRFAPRPLALGGADLRFEGSGNSVGDLVLHRENVFDFAIVALGP